MNETKVCCENCLYSCTEERSSALGGGGQKVILELRICKNDQSPHAEDKFGVTDWDWCSGFVKSKRRNAWSSKIQSI